MSADSIPDAAKAPARPMRADAAKNRELILAAAEETFALEGIAVPIDEVARRAGVGIGTLYRHFPTKEALFEAIVIARIERLVETANDFAHEDDCAQALFTFLREFAKQAAAKRDLIDGLELAGIDLKSRYSESFDKMVLSIDTLLKRAIAAKAIRPDVQATEVIGLVAGACHAGGHSGASDLALQHMVNIVIDGLRPQHPSA